MTKKVWLIGAGLMAKEYSKVLSALKIDYLVIGRGDESAKEFEKNTSKKVVRGGVSRFLQSNPEPCDRAIVCAPIDQLMLIAIDLISYGIKSILLEKPGGVDKNEITKIKDLAQEKTVEVFIAYNRRFYSSMYEVERCVKRDGGLISFNFEFTEWSHIIEGIYKPKSVKENWFLANSTHVVDMAFFLGGQPKELSAYTSGSLSWHPASSEFAGAGITEKNVLFTYCAYWASAGRWSVEFVTGESRYILRPMERLLVQRKGSIEQKPVVFDYSLDEKFKPGLYRQTESFLEGDYSRMCSIEEQINMVDNCYLKMSGYETAYKHGER